METALHPESIIGHLVAEKPARSRIFQRHKIDFCCGGNISVEEACKRAHLDPAQVVAELEAVDRIASDERDWTRVQDVDAIIDHVMHVYHAPLKEDLTRLDALAKKVARVHGGRHPELIQLAGVWDSVRDELTSHLMKEERVLFPLMAQVASAARESKNVGPIHCGSVGNPIRQMEFEHEAVGASLAEMRNLTSGYTPPADACNSYLALYDGLAHFEEELHRHIHLENFVLHPLVQRLEAETAAL